ncbi:hypothetical protein DVZ84_27625 [Streptomyces parvulus]|uniref:Uncharacterized protein n=1 Tax=Streptomyces parvulus TaxID=146923 RepID=A0A369UZE3_9ACTN|nr:hypothetical protein DVZ84_27625 [Streptomyces parvulus]
MPGGPAGEVAIMTGMRTEAPPTRRPVRQLLAASVGNAVEWYDWFSYTGTPALYVQASDLQSFRSARLPERMPMCRYRRVSPPLITSMLTHR